MILSMNMIVDPDELKTMAIDFFESIDMLKLTYRREGNLTANSFEEMRKSYGI